MNLVKYSCPELLIMRRKFDPTRMIKQGNFSLKALQCEISQFAALNIGSSLMVCNKHLVFHELVEVCIDVFVYCPCHIALL